MPKRPPAQQSAGKKQTAKQRTRGLERLLKRDSLPADVRAAKEKELAILRGDVQKQSRVAREKHFSKKYHGVKFIERRKVERRIATVQRSIAEGGGDPAALEEALQEAQHDLLYIQHFPRAKKYLSLFPTSAVDDAYVAKRRRRIRALIVRRVEAGLPVGTLAEEDDDDDDDAVALKAAAADDEEEEHDPGGDDFFAEAEPVPLPNVSDETKKKRKDDQLRGAGKKKKKAADGVEEEEDDDDAVALKAAAAADDEMGDDDFFADSESRVSDGKKKKRKDEQQRSAGDERKKKKKLTK